MNFFQTGEYKKVVAISFPLVLSMGTTTVMEFTDRVFLGNYSLDALAAALPAGLSSFLFTAFFMGVAGYVNVFVAQYTGAKNSEGVGASLWQGIYFTLIGGLFMGLLSFLAEPLFAFIGHNQDVQALEVIYFRILCIGTVFGLTGATLSCFFSGRGITRPILVLHSLGMLFNIPLDYALINGVWGFPEWGIKGAALATVSSWSLVSFLFIALVFTRKNNKQFGVLNRWRFNRQLFMRLMKYGVPGGIQFFLEILAFTFFILIVGQLGKEVLAVSNLVLSINAFAYMPMFGFSMGLSTLVGQAIGKKRPDLAAQATKATVFIGIAYILFLGFIFLFLPEPLIRLFLPSDITAKEAGQLIAMGIVLLRFVVLYLFFDSLSVVYTGALKGAGDTRFVMTAYGSISLIFLFLPVWIGVTRLGLGIYFSWACLTFYMFILFCFIFIRFLKGKWKSMKVI